MAQDDYVKFIRFGQWRIDRSGSGILALITNNSFLDNLTFRGMRKHLLDSFTSVYVLNLHGNIMKRDKAPDGSKDENVFDIQQGVAISIFFKEEENNSDPASVYSRDLQGLRASKYDWLDQHEFCDSDWKELTPSAPYYFFVKQDLTYSEEYVSQWSIKDIFPTNSVGVVTGQDKNVIALLSKDIKVLSQTEDIDLSQIKRINYRPFDWRYVLYTSDHVTRMRFDVMQHLLIDSNLALVFMRQVAADNKYSHFGVSSDLVEARCFYSNRGIMSLAPLYLYAIPGQFDAGDDPSEYPLSNNNRRPNLSRAFVADMESKLGLTFQTEGSAFTNGDSPDWFGPEDVFYYAYAIFHSPTYRERYSEFLKIDFPRLPLTSNLRLFATLVKLGAELVGLHLMKSSKLNEYMTTFDKEGDDEVARGYPKYRPKGGLVHINKTQYFGGVSQEIWDFHIGGYQVMRKWLKDRSGRKLSLDDKEHYQKIVVALFETIRIMTEIDAAIPQFPIE